MSCRFTLQTKEVFENFTNNNMKKINHVQPSRLTGVTAVPVQGHPILRQVCTSVTHSVAFLAILDF